MSDETHTQVPPSAPVSGTEPDAPDATTAGPGARPAADPLTLAYKSSDAIGTDAARTEAAVPGYEILGELGRGAMGVVYKARHAKMNRLVALKMALGGRMGEKDLIRFLAEAQAVASVKHENVVQVYDYGESGGRPYMALEFCPGGSLADRLRDEDDPLGQTAAAQLVARIGAGVAAAHEAGIVHRDLKPGNVLLDAHGAPKVADFGLAKRGASELTATQAVMGTPSYMSPEQAGGKTKFVGPQADVWALGVILYECLTGARPFPGKTTDEVLAGVLTADPPAVRAVAPGTPRDLDLICRKCLEKNPADRYPSGRELADDLERFGRGEPISARPLGAVPRTVRWAKRNPVVAGLMGAVAVITLGLFGSLYGQYRQALAQAGAEREAKEGAERERQSAVLAQQNAERAAQETKLREEAEGRRTQAELVAARSAAEAAQANVLIELLNDMFRSSDPLALFFGEAPPLIGAAGAGGEGQAAVLGPFLRNAAARFRASLTDPAAAPVRAKLLATIGNGMKNLGLFAEAKPVLEEALALRRAHLPETHPDVWRSEIDLALLEAEGGDVLKGIDRFRKVIALQQKAGADPAAVLTTRLYEGVALTSIGLAEAGPVLKDVVSRREQLLGKGHKDTLFAKLALIAWYLEHQNPTELLAQFADFRTHLLAVPDPRARAVFEAITNVQARLMKAYAAKEAGAFLAGTLRETVESMKTDIERLEQVLPEDHLIVLIHRFELAKLLAHVGEDGAADDRFANVLACIRKSVGLAHPKVLVFLEVYAWRLAGAKKVPEARALFDQVEKANRDRFGPDNPWLTLVLLQRAEFERVQGDSVKALACARAAVDLIKRGKFLPTPGALSDLYGAARELGTGAPALRAAARELFAALRPLVETVHGAESEELVEILIAEGKQAYESGDRATAAPVFERVRKLVADNPKANTLHRTNALRWCGKIELDRGRPAEAEALFRAAREAAKSVPGYKMRAEDAELLANALVAQGKWAEAGPLFEELRRARVAAKANEWAVAWAEMRVATACLGAGDRAGYQKAFDGMLARYGKSTSADTLSRIAWAGGLGQPDGWDAGAFETKYGAAYKPETTFPWGYRGLALVRVRAGKFAEVEAALARVGVPSEPVDHVIRGLAAVGRKDFVRARAHLTAAERLIELREPTEKLPFACAGRMWNLHADTTLLLAELRAALPVPALAPPPRAK